MTRLVDHASSEERQQIFREHRIQLLSIGVISGYLGAAPSLIWASGAMFVAMAPILVPVAIWIYTLGVCLSSLWFAHYTLSALEQLRKKNNAQAGDRPAPAAIKSIADETPAIPAIPAASAETPSGLQP